MELLNVVVIGLSAYAGLMAGKSSRRKKELEKLQSLNWEYRKYYWELQRDMAKVAELLDRTLTAHPEVKYPAEGFGDGEVNSWHENYVKSGRLIRFRLA